MSKEINFYKKISQKAAVLMLALPLAFGSSSVVKAEVVEPVDTVVIEESEVAEESVAFEEEVTPQEPEIPEEPEVPEEPEEPQAPVMSKSKITKVVTKTANTQRVYWTPSEGATGYAVFSRTPETRFKKVVTITSGSTKSALVKNRLPGVTYTYQIRPLHIDEEGVKTQGPLSNKISSSINKDVAVYGEDVDYYSYGRYYKYREQALQNMKTITVRTRDFKEGKSGPMYTRTWSLTVHKNLADTVKDLFEELYDAKFPIHELGGWRWDGSRTEHADGTAIDVNWTENPYVVNGSIQVGSYYRPDSDPYSIPVGGEIAKIFEKYGFSQGLWSNSQDYMHFSYFGT